MFIELSNGFYRDDLWEFDLPAGLYSITSDENGEVKINFEPISKFGPN